MECKPIFDANVVMLAVLYSNVFLDLAGFGMALPMMPYLADKLHADAWGVGMVTTSYCVMQVVGNLVFGRAFDKLGRKCILCFCMVGLALSNVAMGFAETLDLFLLARGSAGFFSGVVCIVQAMVSLAVPPESNFKHQGYVGAAIGAGIAFGPGLGSIAMLLVGLRGPLFVSAGLCTANLALTLLFVREPEPAREVHDAGAGLAAEKKGCGDGLAALAREHLRFSPIYLSTLAFWTGYGAFEALGGLYFAGALGMSAEIFGLVCTVNGVGQLLINAFAVDALISSLGAAGAGVSASVCAAVAYALACLATAWAPYVFAAVLSGGFVATVVQASLLSEMSPPASRGTALGMNQAVSSLGRVIGPMLAAAIYPAMPEGIWVLASGCSVLSAACFVSVRWLQTLGAHTEAAEEKGATDVEKGARQGDLIGRAAEQAAAGGA